MEFLKLVGNPHFVDAVLPTTPEEKTELQRELDDARDEVLSRAVYATDLVSQALEAFAGSDVAGGRPRDDGREATYIAGASPGIQGVMMTNSGTTCSSS